jgi:hypothetical protein
MLSRSTYAVESLAVERASNLTGLPPGEGARDISILSE